VNAPIGMGKTSLTKILTEQLGTKGFYENVDDIPMLNDFYSDGNESRSENSFRLQINFLTYRYHQLQEGIWLQQEKGMKNTIYDSSLGSDALMAYNLYKRGEFDEQAYNLYTDLSQTMLSNVSGHPFAGLPNLYIYLHGDFDLMLQHITSRGRENETTDPSLVDYYKSVWDTYESWNDSEAGTSKVVIDMNKYDFVHSLEDRKHVLKQIYDKLRAIGQLRSDEYTNLLNKLSYMTLADNGDKE
jgi:deoxyadenosine/deoxycytidine kinase